MASIRDTILARIKTEITNDPDGLGYAGKTDQEIYNILVSPIVKQRVVDDTFPQPMLKILNNIAEGPNKLTLQDVIDAKTVDAGAIG